MSVNKVSKVSKPRTIVTTVTLSIRNPEFCEVFYIFFRDETYITVMRNKDRFPAKGFIPFERDRNDRTRFFQIAVVVVVVVVVFNDMRVTNTFF